MNFRTVKALLITQIDFRSPLWDPKTGMTFKEGKTQYSEKMVYSYISSSNLTAYLRTVYVLRCNDYENQNEKVLKNVKGVCVCLFSAFSN